MMNSEAKFPDDQGRPKDNDSFAGQIKGSGRQPIELVRPVKINTNPGDRVDSKVIRYNLYNSFNYSLFLPQDYRTIKLSLGITSPNKGEGKTTAVCNLATAISLGTGRKTVVVDLNLSNPRIHTVFGIPQGPGLGEALVGQDICVAPTQIENLFAMSAGNLKAIPPSRFLTFRELLASLFKEFEFVLIDMPSVQSKDFPTLISNQLTGLIVVVKAKKTKRRDVSKLFRRVRQETVLAFVMNEVNENDL